MISDHQAHQLIIQVQNNTTKLTTEELAELRAWLDAQHQAVKAIPRLAEDEEAYKELFMGNQEGGEFVMQGLDRRSPFEGRPNVMDVGRQILELLKPIADHQVGLEMLGEVMASYVQRTNPEALLREALSDSLLAVAAVYMPASKYNGLFFDELDLKDMADQLSVMCDAETFPALNDGTTIGEYPFEYECSYPNIADRASYLAGNHGTGMTIEAIASCILQGRSKHGEPIEPTKDMVAWAQHAFERRNPSQEA